MREIKFRAWVIDRMVYFPKLGGIDDEYETLYWNSEPNTVGGYHRPEDIKLMQYTGLKEKNGKEIWEEDIIKWSVSIVVKGKQEYTYNMMVLEWDYHRLMVCRNLAEMGNVEVIGNRYENPELLEGL